MPFDGGQDLGGRLAERKDILADDLGDDTLGIGRKEPGAKRVHVLEHLQFEPGRRRPHGFDCRRQFPNGVRHADEPDEQQGIVAQEPRNAGHVGQDRVYCGSVDLEVAADEIGGFDDGSQLGPRIRRHGSSLLGRYQLHSQAPEIRVERTDRLACGA